MPNKPRHTKTSLSLAPLSVDDALAALLKTPPPLRIAASARKEATQMLKRQAKKKRAKAGKKR